MPNSKKYNRAQNKRRLDTVKVQIEDVNLNAHPFPMAQGRDIHLYGLFDIDLSHGIGGHFTTPQVGEIWWIKRVGARQWMLDHKVDSTRTDTPGDGGGGGGDSNRSGECTDAVLGFNVREKKTSLEYSAYMTFTPPTTDEHGDPATPSHFIIDWVPVTKGGNIITDEKVRQHIWAANDAAIDDPLDPAAAYYVELPGNVPRPKVWYWKGRIRAVSTGNAKGPWTTWTTPVLPFRVAKPEPPAPGNVDLLFRWKDTAQQPVFSAVTRFDDVNYWDIPGFDYEDDVTSYHAVLEPLQRDSTGTIDGGDGHMYVRADPNGDGTPWEIRQQNIKDKDADDTFVSLGTLAQDITEVDTTFNVVEDGVEDPSGVPIVVLTNTGEEWLVTSRTLVSGNTYTYEVYRQFNDTAFQAHSNAEPLTWLKDPFRYRVDWHHVERPRTVYWRTRVRSKDRFNRLGPYSSWTSPLLPWQSIDFQVPRPRDLRADIEIRDYKTHPEFKLVARFKDAAPNGWNIPGGDLQDDVAHYAVVGEALLQDPNGYIDGGDGYQYRIPDRHIGYVQKLVNPADTQINITLRSDLPHSIQALLKDPDKQTAFLRIETGDVQQDILGNEVVAATALMGTTIGFPAFHPPNPDPSTQEQWQTEPVPLRGRTNDLPGQGVTDEPYGILNEGPEIVDYQYLVERAQKGSGDHGHNVGDFVYLLTEHTRRVTVHDRDEGDPGHFNERYTAHLGRIAQSRNFFWHVRARTVDNFNHKSDWTPWTKPISPSTDPDLVIDPPSYVALNFDRRITKRHQPDYRAIVEWDEVHYLAPDGDREPDVAHYNVQLAASDGDNLDNDITSADTVLSVEELHKPAPTTPFYVLIDDEMVEVTDRDGGLDLEGTFHTYTVTRASRGTDAVAHPQGSLLFAFPFNHKHASARQDKDPNSFDRIIFPNGIQKWGFYKARVKAVDRYNRNSEWTSWTQVGTPLDNTPPTAPKDVLIDVDNHKVVTTWDIEVDPRDTDTDENGRIPGSDVNHFQIQLANNANFHPLMRNDRYVQAMSKTWRLHKPGMGDYYVRVRAVDASGNKSAWVVDSGAQNGVPTPDAPTVVYDTNEETKKLRAIVETTGVTGIDDDIDGYEFQLQPAEYKRINEPSLGIAELLLTVTNSSNVPNTPFTAFIQHEKVHVTNVSGNNVWTLTRGYHTTVAATHRERAKVQYFRADGHRRRLKTGTESAIDDPVIAIFGNIQRGLWYRARVRARNTKGLWGDYSGWSGV